MGGRFLEADPVLWAEILEETLVTRKRYLKKCENYDSGRWSKFMNLVVSACKLSEYQFLGFGCNITYNNEFRSVKPGMYLGQLDLLHH